MLFANNEDGPVFCKGEYASTCFGIAVVAIERTVHKIGDVAKNAPELVTDDCFSICFVSPIVLVVELPIKSANAVLLDLQWTYYNPYNMKPRPLKRGKCIPYQ